MRGSFEQYQNRNINQKHYKNIKISLKTYLSHRMLRGERENRLDDLLRKVAQLHFRHLYNTFT